MTDIEVEEQSEQDAPDSGARLSAAREERGMTLKAVACETKQSLETLKALETMETAHISATVLRMQAMSYARYLNLPAEEIASGYVESRSSTNSANMPNARIAKRRALQRSWFVPSIVAASVVFAALGLVWVVQPSTDTVENTPVADLIAVPQGPSVDRMIETAETRREISVRALKAAWIEVRGSDGTIFRSRNMARGEVYFPRMNAGWTLTVRDGAAFEWVYADIAVGFVGEAGQPVYSVNIDAVTKDAEAKVRQAMADTATSGGGSR